MKALAIIHAPFERPGVIEEWFQAKDHFLVQVHPYRGDILPTMEKFDSLIVMGGPQSPLEIEKAPYLRSEIQLIEHALKQNMPILGFCLGAQLIGEALGAKTERSPHKEVGVYPITLTAEGEADPIFENVQKTFQVTHWHNDMPGLTKTSKILAYSEGCPRQVIRYTEKALGFQCHPEITFQLAQELVDNCPEDLKPNQYVQSAEEFLEHNFQMINQTMIHILDNFYKL